MSITKINITRSYYTRVLYCYRCEVARDIIGSDACPKCGYESEFATGQYIHHVERVGWFVKHYKRTLVGFELHPNSKK